MQGSPKAGTISKTLPFLSHLSRAGHLKPTVGFIPEPLCCPGLCTCNSSAFCSPNKYPLPFSPLPHSAANHRKVRGMSQRLVPPPFLSAFAGHLQMDLPLCSQIIFDVSTKQHSPHSPFQANASESNLEVSSWFSKLDHCHLSDLNSWNHGPYFLPFPFQLSEHWAGFGEYCLF